MLTGHEIRRHRDLGNISVDPWDDGRVNPNSVNVRLGGKLLVYPENLKFIMGETDSGNWLVSDSAEDLILERVMDDIDGDSVLDTAKEPQTISLSIPPEGIVLLPGVLYLGHTMESISSRGFAPMIEGRSSAARCGVSVHLTAGFGDNFFHGSLTLEITCVFPVKVYAGSEIAQVAFHPLEGEQYPKYTGKYSGRNEPMASGWWKDFHK